MKVEDSAAAQTGGVVVCVPCRRLHLRALGVIRVVTTTIATMAENVAALITG
jgi:hypothetical protein